MDKETVEDKVVVEDKEVIIDNADDQLIIRLDNRKTRVQ